MTVARAAAAEDHMTADDRHARLTEIYDAWSGLILAYAARRTDDPADAADVVAETFAVAWRRIEDVPSGDEARPWLYGVARRVLANHHRGGRRRAALSRRVAEQTTGVVEAAGRRAEGPTYDAIRAAFAQLSERDQEVLTLVAWEQLDRAEVATVLGVSRATVRVRLHRARRRFEQAMAAQGLQRTTSSGHGTGGWVPIARSEQEEHR